ncbi:MAG: class I SAM-dependent methyltransferase [bacterium]
MLVDDYPHIPKVRWGHGKPPHHRLEMLVAAGTVRYAQFLQRILKYREPLWNIAVDEPESPIEPFYRNMFFPGLDCAALYTFVAELNPRSYIEIGSGNSTKFVARAIRDQSLKTQVTSIDPNPRADIDALCDRNIRSPLEDCNPAIFEEMEQGDILFFDGSHRCLQNSDVTCFFLEVIPRLPSGVVIHIHDIFLPEDYPPEWFDRSYSEQYLLAVFLMAKNDPANVLLPNSYVSSRRQFTKVLDSLWDDPRLASVERHGHSFWFEA